METCIHKLVYGQIHNNFSDDVIVSWIFCEYMKPLFPQYIPIVVNGSWGFDHRSCSGNGKTKSLYLKKDKYLET